MSANPIASQRRALSARRALLWNVFVALLLAGLTALAFAAPPARKGVAPVHNGSARPNAIVGDDGGGGGGGGGPTTRYVPSEYGTIQAAINASSSGDTVYVNSGTYTGPGNVDLDFGGRNISLIGPNASTTIIDCGGSSSGTHRGFYIHNGETSSALVQNLTVTNGYMHDYGGAVTVTSSSPTFRNCVFSNSTCDVSGGAYGGGLYVSGSNASPTFTNCVFANNTAQGLNNGVVDAGSAACILDANDSMTFVNCLFTGNQVISGGDVYGGTIHIQQTGSNVTLTNCTLAGNSVTAPGTAYSSVLMGLYAGTVTITNTLIYGNTGAGPFYLYGNSSLSITYSDVQGGWGDTGDFDTDPLFVGSGDYHLSAGSPCIDAGTPTGAPATDLDGSTRDAAPDMGAYEFNGHASLTLTGVDINPTATQSFTGTVATLSDTNPNAPASDFTATIDWGDTTQSAGTVTANGNGNNAASQFNIGGTHTYALPGQYTVTTTVTENTFGTQKQTTSTATIGALGTNTTLAFSNPFSVFGQSVTFYASIVSSQTVNEGAVHFVDTSTNTDLGTYPVNSNGFASFSTSALGVGDHTISATYSDTGGAFSGSSTNLVLTVNKADTITTLTLPSTTPVSTQTFSISATVAPVAPGAGTPTGTVTFNVNGTPQDAPLTNGTASITIGPFIGSANGSVSISAAYNGDTNFTGSATGTQYQPINNTDTTTTLTLPATTPDSTQTFTVAAAVTSVSPGAGTPGGYVNFTVNGQTQTVLLSNDGSASIVVGPFAAGQVTVSAAYNGFPSFNPSASGTQNLTINNPVPAILKQVGDPVPAGSPGFSQLIKGTGFVPSSVVSFDGTARTTKYVSATQLRTYVNASELTVARKIAVVVTNPAPGGGTSNTGQLLVTLTTLSVGVGNVTSDGHGGYLVTLGVTNTGHAAAVNARLTAATLGGAATTTPMQVKLGTLTAGQGKPVTLAFPASAGMGGQMVTLKVTRTFQGDPYRFQYSVSGTLP